MYVLIYMVYVYLPVLHFHCLKRKIFIGRKHGQNVADHELYRLQMKRKLFTASARQLGKGNV